jgi:hypothetical protein
VLSGAHDGDRRTDRPGIPAKVDHDVPVTATRNRQVHWRTPREPTKALVSLAAPKPLEVVRVQQPHVRRATELNHDRVALSGIEVVIQELHDFLRLYGDWFVGLSETPVSDACVLTADSVRPNFKPITRVGVFSRASWRSAALSLAVQALPLFLVYLAIAFSLLRRREPARFLTCHRWGPWRTPLGSRIHEWLIDCN